MSDAGQFLNSHPSLRAARRRSASFERIKREAGLDIDGERLYIVRGDTLGDEDDLFVETIVRGAQSDDPGDPARALYLELDGSARQAADARAGRT